MGTEGRNSARAKSRTDNGPCGTRRPARPHAAFAGENPAVLREYYRQMALIRAFELRAAEMYTRAKIGGYCHLNLGEEAPWSG